VKPFSRAFMLATVLTACWVLPCRVAAQRPSPGGQPQRGGSADVTAGTADLVVTLHDAKNAAFLQTAKVTLRNSAGEVRGTSIAEKGRAVFRTLPLDTYEISVEVQGSPTTKASVALQLAGENKILDVVVGSGNSSAGASGPPLPPPLSMKEQKELTDGLRALQAQRIDEARKHFLAAAKTNPNQPDVDYLLGVIAAMTGDVVTAKQYFENAANRYQHVRSLTALGELDLTAGNLPEAKTYLERALKADPNTWRAEQLLAAVNLRQQAYPEAIEHAERALQAGKAEAKGARLTLAEALSATGNYQRSTEVVNELLKQSPTQEQSKEAREILESNRQELAPHTLSASSNAASVSASGTKAPAVGSLPLSPSLPAASANPLTESARWIPPNVDDSVPPADSSVSCPLANVVDQAGTRVLQLVDNLDRFTATERLHHETLNEFGLAVRNVEQKYDYSVYIHEVRPGIFDVSEYRDGSESRDIFPEHVATLGTVALVLVFHPHYAEDFDFKCEGLAHQGNQLAWQVHYQQKPGRPSRLRSYRLGTKYYRVGLKGRAWIAADSFQIIRMESDLVNQVPDLRLYAEHQDILYGPVPFKKRDTVLWLPYSAETFLDFNVHRIHRRQDFTNYLLFWVDEKQNIEKPKEATEEPAGEPNT
jgi:tetratricopeptide (TPR) repeat protein